MHSYLQDILMHKKNEVAQLKHDQALQAVLERPQQKACLSRTSFKSALLKPKLQIIAEVKRKSPSKGHLSAIADPVQLANKYVLGGAAAISVLTDQYGFNGSIDDLKEISHAVKVPTLRKDFIIDPLQIAQAYQCGASAVLLITSLLDTQLSSYINIAKSLGLDALVEVHTEAECEFALAAGADIVGINNRDLTTFKVDCRIASRIKKTIPNGIVTVAESGIQSAELARQYADEGFDAVLVGEYLVTASDPLQAIQACQVGQ